MSGWSLLLRVLINALSGTDHYLAGIAENCVNGAFVTGMEPLERSSRGASTVFFTGSRAKIKFGDPFA